MVGRNINQGGEIFTFNPFEGTVRCHADWGQRGAAKAAERGDIIVVVDVLSFSTSVSVAADRGALVYPCTREDNPAEMAGRLGGEAAVRRAEVPAKGRYSLSPHTFVNVESGTKIILASPNGATISRIAGRAPHVFAGALINAEATARAVSSLMETSELRVTVIACGERDKEDESRIRWAVEDYLGAGAILAGLDFEKSAEARVCEGAFLNHRNDLDKTLWDCESGLELREMGYGEDVTFSSKLNIINSMPGMHGDYFRLGE